MSHLAPYIFHEGRLPLLVSMPHVGVHIPADIEATLQSTERAVQDTDWHVDALYSGFLMDMGASIIKATHSRTVVDLNRPADDQKLYPGQITTGLCPTETFDGQPLYKAGMEPDTAEIARRIDLVWQPYHSKLQWELQRLVSFHGFAILWDAHSIKAHVPRLFMGKLPDLNFGTNDGASCAADLLGLLMAEASKSPYSHVANGRFKGGYITRHYGQPEKHVHAVQLELSQDTYLDDAQPPQLSLEKAGRIRPVLEGLIQRLRHFIPS